MRVLFSINEILIDLTHHLAIRAQGYREDNRRAMSRLYVLATRVAIALQKMSFAALAHVVERQS